MFAPDALAQETPGININLGESGTLSGRVVQMILLLTVLSLAPSILIMMTSFTRMVIVFSLLRSAMGTQQTPPNMVIISLALFLTGYVMAPTLTEVYTLGIEPLVNEEIDEVEAYNRASVPLRNFMLSQVREKDLALFVDLSGENISTTTPDTVPMTTLVPAFMISEIRRAFEIGFLLYIPFVVIDMVVASILMSMGMMMLPPVMIATPFKLIFFVLVDGWNLVAGSLVQSFGQAPPPGVGG
ncbi:flagellar type III secretion system pore protein FliP [Kordiimonas laminariae]|uniref:flagellar type III secretion system pore protein FliP n=1 Tax=Kordiimonas laminariae TaxID=2917717 RepID=UPI001FF42791|nr:flagellar type III secretion system pore protein FliP [Kordiimonas laminariae]MCK0069792.1 flagellar type III secretion system pore protein FliP [Kordiimonas laminariae]